MAASGTETFNHDLNITDDCRADTSIISGTTTLTPTDATGSGATFPIVANQILLNISQKTDPNSALTISDVSNSVTGIQDSKDSCRAKTDVALDYVAAGATVGKTLTANPAAALPTIDGVTLSVGDRVLVDKFGTSTGSDVDNGIYTVTQTTSPWIMTRAIDFDENDKVSAGSSTFVVEGSYSAKPGQFAVSTPEADINLDVNPLNFTQTNAGTAVVITTKGDLRVGDENGIPDRLPIGANEELLVADPRELPNLKYDIAFASIENETLLFKADYFGNGSDGDTVISGSVTLEPSGLENTVSVSNYRSLCITSGSTLSLGARRSFWVIYVIGDCCIEGTLSANNIGANEAAAADLKFTRAIFKYTTNGLDGVQRITRTVSMSGATGGAGGTGASSVGTAGSGGTDNGPETGFDDNDPAVTNPFDGFSGGGGGGGSSTTSFAGGLGSDGTALCGGSGGGGGGASPGGAAGINGGLGGTAGGGGSGIGAGNSLAVAGIGAISNGGGGTIVLIVGGNLVMTGTISAMGGAGDPDGSTAGGGGGSGGGNILVYYGGNYIPDLGTYNVSGGAGGTSASGGAGGVGGKGSIQGPFQIAPSMSVQKIKNMLNTTYSITIDTSAVTTVGAINAIPIPGFTASTGIFRISIKQSAGATDAPAATFRVMKVSAAAAGSVSRLSHKANVGGGAPVDLGLVWNTGAESVKVFTTVADSNGGNVVIFEVVVS